MQSRQPYTRVDYIPQSETKNLASGNHWQDASWSIPETKKHYRVFLLILLLMIQANLFRRMTIAPAAAPEVVAAK